MKKLFKIYQEYGPVLLYSAVIFGSAGAVHFAHPFITKGWAISFMIIGLIMLVAGFYSVSTYHSKNKNSL